MYTLYTLLLLLGGIGLLPRLLWRSLQGAAYHRDLRERLGWQVSAAAPSQAPAAGCLWFHAASVGEVQGVQPILAAVHRQFPMLPVVLSTFTPAGKLMAQRIAPEASAVFVLPVDLPWIMRRLVRRLQPRALIVQETELWPNLFHAVAQQRVPVVVVNGRLSPRAFRRYLWIRPLMQRVLANVTLLLAQSADTAQRFQRLGAIAQRVCVVGNTNIDRALHAAERPPGESPLAALFQGRRVFVGGSTHEGEETILLSVYRRLRCQHPDLLLVLAPRHLERVETVLRHVQASQCHALRRSQGQAVPAVPDTPIVVILDTMGELPVLYSLCMVAFVGGTLAPIGGHNILEPAVFAKPLFFGPHMHHFPELAAMLCAAGGAKQVGNAEELYAGVAHILAHPDAGRAMGQRALQALIANRGALERTVQAVTPLLCKAGREIKD
jgi:3-deoxy-D-manno-octulosonic-acid transferase